MNPSSRAKVGKAEVETLTALRAAVLDGDRQASEDAAWVLRARGWTRAEIGESIGVSRQAAHQRWAVRPLRKALQADRTRQDLGLAKPVEAHNRTGWGPLVVGQKLRTIRPVAPRSVLASTHNPARTLAATNLSAGTQGRKETPRPALGTVAARLVRSAASCRAGDRNGHAQRQHDCDRWA